MTTSEAKQKTWNFIDDFAMELSRKDWYEFLQELSADADIRAETVALEIEAEDELHED